MQLNKIVLAVDVFSEEAEASAEKVARSVRGLIPSKNTLVEAVYVMTPGGVGVPREDFPEHLDYFRQVAGDMLALVMADTRGIAKTDVTILPQDSNSVRAGVDRLLQHVEENGADLIALTTHCRKGLDRLFLGSFAETLLLGTATPLLITSTKTPWDPAFHHILFATDLAEDFTGAFDAAIGLAKQLGAKVTIFHRLDPEIPFLPPLGFIAVQEWQARKTDRQNKALSLQDRARREGVAAEIEIDMQNRRLVSSILSAADRLKASLIMMGARKRSHALAIGSTPRQIVRESPCPVLIYPEIEINQPRSSHEEIE